MPLRYDPDHVQHWVPKAGIYTFEVLGCEEARFRTGSHGIELRLAVDTGGSGARRAPLRITDRVVFGERSTWKMHDLCRATGVRFDPPCEAQDLVGKRGRAEFGLDARDDLLTLRVVRYLPRDDGGRGG